MSEISFRCDDMFEGLARWLRAAGYEAVCEQGIGDAEVVRRAEREGRMLLTSDSGIMERRPVREGRVKCLMLPRGLANEEALSYVMGALGLELRPARCMACGGELKSLPKESVEGEAPPRVYRAYDEFFRCDRCGKLFWHGSHWEKIVATLERAREAARRLRG